MQELAQYFSYEEANARQLELLAIEIPSKVEMVAPPQNFLGIGQSVYVLKVDAEDLKAARDALGFNAQPAADTMLCCPKCGSTDVVEQRGTSKDNNIINLMGKLFREAPEDQRQLVCRSCEHTWDLY